MQETTPKKLAEYQGEDQVISSHEMMMRLKSEPESILNLKSNIPKLDAATEGFREGELITISGPTKMGKTLLAQTLTAAFVKQQHFPLWFSFEVPVRQFLNQFPKMPLIYLPSRLKAHVLPWFEERVQESFEKYHTRIIFIDHLHYLIDLARIRNPSIEIGQIIRRLKTLAVSGQYLIFLLCHTTKGASDLVDNLSYESIRDSSFISQESDSVFMVKRVKDVNDPCAARVRVEFHRRTGALEQAINLTKLNGYLVEKETREDENEAGRYR